MQAFRTIATGQPEGRLAIAGIPFKPGEQVEVVILGTERTAARRRQQWKALFRRIQACPEVRRLTEADIQAETAAVRGRRKSRKGRPAP